MDKVATENLFLLEILVDDLKLNPKCDCAMGEGERCVSFQFLDNAPLDICEEPTPWNKQGPSDKNSVKSGKSCLFSLSPDQAKEAIDQFDIRVTVFKRMPAGWLPEKVEIGEALISVANLFSDLIDSVAASDGSTPTAKTLKDSFDINDTKGGLVGNIEVYIRMSCFGKLIVTQFQMNLGDKSVLFKDKEGKSLYKYRKSSKGKKVWIMPVLGLFCKVYVFRSLKD